jgi:hypothetical protein
MEFSFPSESLRIQLNNVRGHRARNKKDKTSCSNRYSGLEI